LFNVFIDASSLQNLASLETIQEVSNKAAANLALLTQAKVQELAGEKLHSRLEMFRKGLSFKKEEDGVYIIHLDEEQAWINDGYAARSLIPDLLNSPKAKTALDGSKYLCVPFQMTAGKVGATQTTQAGQELVQAMKQQLKQATIPFAKTERDSSGMPLLGRIHKLQLKTPLKKRDPEPGHGNQGMGHGAVGQPMQGPTGRGFLEGAGVYQSLNSRGKVERSVISFRVASSKQIGTGLWDHPGLEPTHIFEDAYEFALRELETNVMPHILKEISERSGQ
jgi:hypothetical protein